MIVSGEKTKLMITSTSANRRNKLGDSDVNIRVDGLALIESKSEKLFGVFANRDGNWRSHLHGDGFKNKGLLDLSKRIGMLRHLRRNLLFNQFKILVSGLFTSKLIYGITAWGSVRGYGARFKRTIRT